MNNFLKLKGNESSVNLLLSVNKDEDKHEIIDELKEYNLNYYKNKNDEN